LVEASLLKDPFKTCSELARAFDVSKELVRKCFHNLGFSYKKARYYGVAKNSLQLTRTFLKRRDAYIQEGRQVYSVDETGFGRFSYSYRAGWAPRGKELRVVKTKARQTTTSVLACASETRWVKTTEVSGAFNRAMFCSFVRGLDLPTGSVLLLDNASIHKGYEVFQAFRDKQFVPLYTPPYSPWFNPIEGCFSVVKRNYPVSQDITESFDALTSQHFAAFFRRSFAAYGVDDADAAVNRAEMDKPDPTPRSKQEKHKKRLAVVSTETIAKVVVGRQKTEDGGVIETRTRTIETTVKRARVGA
jgi:transposase